MTAFEPRPVESFTDQEREQLMKIHKGILSRCYCRSDTSYPLYGGRKDRRPIGVDDEWRGRGGFRRFLDWAAVNGWRPGLDLQIDRIADQDYGPTTCRIITRSQNCRNRRTCQMIRVNGITLAQADWAEVIGAADRTLSMIRRNGGDVEEYIRQRLLAPGRRGKRRTGIYPD